jgi:hypothetical protein
MLVAATKAYTQAFAPGVPGLPSPEGIKNILEYEIREPMKLAAPSSAQRMFNFRFVEESRRSWNKRRRVNDREPVLANCRT